MKYFWLLVLTTITTVCRAADYIIETSQPRQTIRHFGASDAWSMQFIGLWDNEAEQEKIADWLFSTENDSQGQPKGIGLSVWRFNLGAGSAEQGRESQINPGTRTECFLTKDGTYDWTKLNSAPVYFTQNGLATNTGRDGTINLKDDCYDDFARFMATSLKGLEEQEGIHFDYLCPVNEPDGHWNWLGPKQEGSPATHREIARLARETSKALTEQGLNTQILMDESSDIRCLLGIHETDWQRGNAISTFFSPDSTLTYVGNLPNVPHLVAAHSYWTNTPIPYMKKVREQLREECKKYGIKFWQTEICIMGNDTEIGGGQGYDFTMKTALYVARVIHHDLTYADAESWSWWRACGGNYRDGLIRVYEREQRARDSKLLWALGNFSRFIRPGAVRYEVSSPKQEDPFGLMVSAYQNEDGKWVCVAINYSDKPQDFKLSFSDKKKHSWQIYRTSDAEGENLKPIGICKEKTQLSARSISTFVEK